MFQQFPSRILCPVDFSDMSVAALQHATQLRSASNGTIIAMHAYSFEAPMYFTRTMADGLKQQYAQAASELAGTLQEFIHNVLQSNAEIHVEEGDPARSIVASAETFGSDLIVMGTHGRRGWQRLMLGSVTERVLRTSLVPVLTVQAAPPPQPIARILVPVNNSIASRQALQKAARLAAALHAFVTVVHVDEGDHPEQIGDLCAWINETERPDCQVKHVKKSGNAAEQVLTLAKEIAADLIVMGAVHKKFLDSTVLGTTTVRVVRHASVPVLAVPLMAI